MISVLILDRTLLILLGIKFLMFQAFKFGSISIWLMTSRLFRFHCLVKFTKKLDVQNRVGTPLVAQWLRIHLPMQGTQVRALVREDPTCRGATKPERHNYWACALEPASHNCWSPCAQSPCSATREITAMRSLDASTKSSPHSPQLEKACTQQRRPNTAKNK